MPVLSKFYGIIIRMYFQQSEHNPLQEKKIIEGELPKKALELVMEWIGIHEKELKEIWDTQHFKSIKPLE